VLPHIDSAIPAVGVCNISETFYEFLSSAEDLKVREQLVKGEQYRGDRVLVWFGDNKLVLGSFPIPHAQFIYEQCGYANTQYLSPQQPSPWLSRDILNEPALLQAIIDYAGPGQTLQLIPYATTIEFLELVRVLREEHGLTVLLPETPGPEAIWTRDYIDTKVGWRVLAGRWLPNADVLLPEGFVCHNDEIAADAAAWFVHRGVACLAKCDIGENGFGNLVIHPEDQWSRDEILERIRKHGFVGSNWVTVEALVNAEKPLSPSLEVYVPPVGQGEPYVTYLSDQLFHQFGDFVGVIVSRELNQKPWSAPITEAGLIIGRELQKMGYVGNFDLDAVVDDNERIFLLEVNPRRTGGTHVHEFAHYVFGPDYLDKYAFLSNDSYRCPGIRDFDTLLKTIGDLTYPLNGEQRGLVIMVTSALEVEEFGCIIVGADTADTLSLERQLSERLKGLQ
jgi:hypothetical protein